METEKIKVFLRVIELGSLSETAQQLGYTTSGVSRLVASVEEDAGFPLLLRSRTGTKPTRECLALLPIMKELARQAEYYAQRSNEIRGLELGSIAIGTAYNAYYPRLSRVIADFIRIHPGITVQIIEDTSSGLVERLESGDLTLGIISQRPGGFHWLPLCRNELIVLAPQGHPLAQSGSFPLDRLSAEPFIELFPGRETDNSLFLSEAGIRMEPKYSTYDVEAAVAMVQAGLGITLVNDLCGHEVPEDVAALPIWPPQQVNIGIAIAADEFMSPAAKRFAAFFEKNFVEEFMRQTQPGFRRKDAAMLPRECSL